MPKQSIVSLSQKLRRRLGAIARSCGLKDLGRKLERSVPGAVVKDVVIGGATLAKVSGMLFGRLLGRRELPLANNVQFGDLLLGVRDYLEADSARARVADGDDLDVVRMLATHFFGDDGPRTRNRERRAYFGDLHSGNQRVFAIWMPLYRHEDPVPCGYTSVVPLKPATFEAYAVEARESQFSWDKSQLADRAALRQAARDGTLKDFGIYLQAVGVLGELREAAPDASVAICVQALMHVFLQLDGIEIAAADEMPRIVAEATMPAGERLMRRWALFTHIGDSVDGYPIFELDRGLMFDLRHSLEGRVRRLFFLGDKEEDGDRAA